MLRHPIPPSKVLALATFAALFAAPLSASADEWQNWRGPNHNGSSEALAPPSKFSPTENVRWAADMPGGAGSTPIIAAGKVFVSSTDEAKKKLVALAFDLASGKELWRHPVGDGLAQDNRSTLAGPSPVATDKHVVFFYGTGDLAVFTHSGELVWKKNIQTEYGSFYYMWTYSSSPIVVGDKIILQILQRDSAVHDFQKDSGAQDSFLLALDLASGKELYKAVRPNKAVAESKESFTTPFVHTREGKTELIVAGGDCLTGHDSETGRELWRWGTWNPKRIGHWRLVPSAVTGDGIALICAPKQSPVYAIKLGGKGELPDSAIAWSSDDKTVSSDVSTPLFYRGRFYILNSDKKSIACIVPASGKVLWNQKLDCNGKIEASPTAADGKIYFISHHGETFVIAAGDTFELLHRIDMGPAQLHRPRRPHPDHPHRRETVLHRRVTSVSIPT